MYTSKALQAAGLDVGHERLGRDGIVSSMWALDVDEYPAYHEQGPQPEFDVILHQVRHPLDAIGSLTTALPESWAWNARYMPIANKPVLEKAALYWYLTNLIAEKRASWTYRIESLPDIWREFTRRLKIKAGIGVLAGIPKNINSREHDTVTWKQIRGVTVHWDQIRKLARSYGYET